MSDLSRYVHYALGFVDFEGYHNEDIPLLMEKFVQFCESYSKITKYYLIAHDDTNILHIHFIFYSLSQVQIMTYFNKLRAWFIPKYVRADGGIQIEKCESINGHLKYLVHQTKESIKDGKKPYSIEDFVSNDDIENIDNLMHSKKGSIDPYMLRDAVLDCYNEFELMVRLTLPVYHRYHNEIRCLQEMRAVLAFQREEERKSHLEDNLPF